MCTDLALTHAHPHTGMAATFCHRVRGSQLILTHFSQRYGRPTNQEEGEGSGMTTDQLVHDARDTLCKLGDSATRIDVSAADDFKVYRILAKK